MQPLAEQCGWPMFSEQRLPTWAGGSQAHFYNLLLSDLRLTISPESHPQRHYLLLLSPFKFCCHKDPFFLGMRSEITAHPSGTKVTECITGGDQGQGDHAGHPELLKECCEAHDPGGLPFSGYSFLRCRVLIPRFSQGRTGNGSGGGQVRPWRVLSEGVSWYSAPCKNLRPVLPNLVFKEKAEIWLFPSSACWISLFFGAVFLMSLCQSWGRRWR